MPTDTVTTPEKSNVKRVSFIIDRDTYEGMAQAASRERITEACWIRKNIYAACWDVVPLKDTACGKPDIDVGSPMDGNRVSTDLDLNTYQKLLTLAYLEGTDIQRKAALIIRDRISREGTRSGDGSQAGQVSARREGMRPLYVTDSQYRDLERMAEALNSTLLKMSENGGDNTAQTVFEEFLFNFGGGHKDAKEHFHSVIEGIDFLADFPFEAVHTDDQGQAITGRNPRFEKIEEWRRKELEAIAKGIEWEN